MLVSIIIPVFNVEPYIVRCLNSVIAQDYTGAMECILVDDCGQDQSVAIARKVIDVYHGSIHFRIVTHEDNRGLAASRNTGIESSQGHYLYFLDSDDWIEPDCISSMMALAERYPGIEMIQAGATPHGGNANPWLNMLGSSLPEFIQGKDAVQSIMLDRNQIPVTAWNRLVKKDVLLHQHLFFQDGLIHEDELWTFQLALHLSSLAILKKNTYHYEFHSSGLMASASITKDESLVSIVRQMIISMKDSCSYSTVSYITAFIQLRSFDVRDESLRIAMLDQMPQLYPYYSFIRKLQARFWLALASLPIRNYYWLYTLLYHWKI